MAPVADVAGEVAEVAAAAVAGDGLEAERALNEEGFLGTGRHINREESWGRHSERMGGRCQDISTKRCQNANLEPGVWDVWPQNNCMNQSSAEWVSLWYGKISKIHALARHRRSRPPFSNPQLFFFFYSDATGKSRHIRTTCSFSHPACLPLDRTVRTFHSGPNPMMCSLTSSGLFCAHSKM